MKNHYKTTEMLKTKPWYALVVEVQNGISTLKYLFFTKLDILYNPTIPLLSIYQNKENLCWYTNTVRQM